ncbi:MAG TPA: cbb3-type cytochrome oxidase assembly protein CcoS [Steroidobacteraceae bacterium]|nr:cbb3-type cytochrome oxidase assembly protein CcoS [Steroidobacteraceae bacterium]
MSIVFVLIPLSLGLVIIAICAFLWAVRTGQFDELDAAAWEILVQDRGELPAPPAPAAPAVPAGPAATAGPAAKAGPAATAAKEPR